MKTVSTPPFPDAIDDPPEFDTSQGTAIQGLAGLHTLSFTTDTSGLVSWMSDEFASFCGGAHHYIGTDWTDLLAPCAEGGSAATIHRRLLTQAGTHGLRVELEPTPGATAAFDLSSIQIEADAGAGSLAMVLRPVEDGSQRAGARPQPTGLSLALLEALPDAILAIDHSGHIFFSNSAAAELLQRSTHELLDRPIAQVFPRGTDLLELASCMQPGAGERELTLPRADDVELRVALRSQTLDIPEGAVCRVLTMRKQDQRDARCAKLEHKVAELEGLVQSVAHDLRSPLVSLLGFTRLLEQDYHELLDETGKHFLHRIEQAGHSMNSLIRDLLEISRIGRADEPSELVDPRGVLLQLHAELKPQLEQQGVELRVPANPPLVLCNRTRLYQVFSNLVGNALRHMGPCEAPVITVEIEELDDAHHITVADNGRGIAPEAHERIFEMFQSLGRRGERDDSTGMGLAIVKKIAETHDGRVWVESQPSQGSCFHLTLRR